ncbi:MAG: hypothetical protein COV36_00880 [Alphaproteobacteria bacterium CG11_big_fil_rev_8_21_14_0_20_44_7]|nr:MAG: hypothetical protein COV36_00880 [Alphaproteobacteria bacterium CG11_big_fil_rev_8_21_14_0_20_44_7]
MENKIAKHWIILAITALGLSGIFSILLVVGRTTDLLDFLGIEDAFKVSLIVHVNLGVLVWFLSMAVAVSFSYYKTSERTYGSWLILPLSMSWAGALLIALAGFIPPKEVFTNNYIPIIDSWPFSSGMYFLCSFMPVMFMLIAFNKKIPIMIKSLPWILIIGVLILYYNVFMQDDEFPVSHAYYESLFWGFGHILQFAYVQLMLICWVILSNHLGLKLIKNQKLENAIFLLPVAFLAITTPYIIFSYPIDSAEYTQAFTHQMIWGASLAAIPFGVMLLIRLFQNFNPKNPLYSALLFSFLLFALGAGLGGAAAKSLLIDGDITTIIPAHYHGSTIGITVALMGFAYYFFRINSRAANTQIWMYSIGQIMYIIALAIQGGHGAARKTAGVEGLDIPSWVIHMQRSGGLLVLIGGFMFVWLVFANLWRNRQLSR